MAMRTGRVCLAAGSGGHMRLTGGHSLRISLLPGPAVSGHTPSVDELFRSAVPIAGRVVAALLTGMGRDGADGLLALRQQGATTIGQDEATSVVYGMPRAAQEIGAVQRQLPLNQIGAGLLRLCADRSPVKG
jgi:two-component system, chemotaxis family, protein-glutamate methylesterase/glutaminase